MGMSAKIEVMSIMEDTAGRQIETELQEVEKLLSLSFSSTDFEAKVNDLCQSVVKAGGKRLRPRLSLLCAHLCNVTEEEMEKSCLLAAAAELLHTATLIHDDVIDNSPQRRGQDTLNALYGNHVAVLAGDYLFTRCFNLLQRVNSLSSMQIISDAIATLVSGEINQLQNVGNQELTKEYYYQTIYAKTGVLFELCCKGFAVCTGRDPKLIEALQTYGREVGYAFQIADDVLDYSSDEETLGKSPGVDLKDGRITLPVILAFERLDEKDSKKLHEAVELADFATVKALIGKAGALTLSLDEARSCAQRAQGALQDFADGPYKAILCDLAQKAFMRTK